MIPYKVECTSAFGVRVVRCTSTKENPTVIIIEGGSGVCNIVKGHWLRTMISSDGRRQRYVVSQIDLGAIKSVLAKANGTEARNIATEEDLRDALKSISHD